VPEKVETAEEKDLRNPSKAIMVKGKVLDEQCNPLDGAVLYMCYTLDSNLKFGLPACIMFSFVTDSLSGNYSGVGPARHIWPLYRGKKTIGRVISY